MARRRVCLAGDKKHLRQDPKSALTTIFDVAEDCKLGWQMHLLHRFGLDAETMTILKGFRVPRSAEDAKELLVAGSLHTFWGRVLDAKKDAITHSSSRALVRIVKQTPEITMEKKSTGNRRLISLTLRETSETSNEEQIPYRDPATGEEVF